MASRRRRRATTAGAAALAVVFGGAVASCGAAGPEAEQVPQRAELAFKNPMGTSYLRYIEESERRWVGGSSDPFYVRLAASTVTRGKGSARVRDIKVTVDTTATKSVTFTTMNRKHGCKGVRGIITCTPKDIASGEQENLWLFNMVVRKNAEKGPAGPMKVTVTSDNAPTLHHTSHIVIGSPRLTARDLPWASGPVEPGSELTVRPAFGNKGDVDVEGDLSVAVEVVGQATLRRRYGNCRYDKADAPKKALCTIPGPLPAGAAYETDHPFTVAVDSTGSQGKITATLYPAPNTPTRDLLPDSAPRGTGAPLGFRPTDGSNFDQFDRELAPADMQFRTTRRYDRQVNGFTIKGKVGQTLGIGVMDAAGYLEGSSYVTLPEGVSLIPHQEGEASELLYCEYTDEKNRKVLCPAPNNPAPELRVRIDKRVEGARGTVSVEPDPEHPDPDLTNNTAPITMEYVD
ncbi:hypothetical protein MUU72_24450 [Streptomyces sp. RS10V-4]|uniref:hypothetical protein n=1 Tax=Streptomyces rhizoryzae TaxID=2932493 RepID=UPI00200646B4|nr:hypothetical protein [Streptomyces rhizoryzae]MCK7626219.1 hypothetical protein [Streptomyces rhizoryzae]